MLISKWCMSQELLSNPAGGTDRKHVGSRFFLIQLTNTVSIWIISNTINWKHLSSVAEYDSNHEHVFKNRQFKSHNWYQFLDTNDRHNVFQPAHSLVEIIFVWRHKVRIQLFCRKLPIVVFWLYSTHFRIYWINAPKYCPGNESVTLIARFLNYFSDT